MARITLFQVRRDTAANWLAVNPVLAAGEQGLETDTRQFKFGDGVTQWSLLDYASAEGSGGGGAEAYADLADAASVNLPAVNTALAAALANKADNTVFNAAAAGLVPASGGGTATFLRADGSFATPSGAGDMLLSGTQEVTGQKTFATGTLIALEPQITDPVGLVKGDVGLDLVDNTSDLSKPISTLTQAALNLKANTASPTFTGTVGGITASMVGLGNVNNTSDAAKPISTLTQAALDAKAAIASPAFTGTPTAPTASAGTSTTQVATTAFVNAERSNTATLTNKTISGSSNTLANIAQASVTNLTTDLAAKASYYAVRDETGTSFTLSATNHANRRTDASNASAIAVTFNTSHGMTKGDCGRIVQTAAGAVTISASGGATLTLSPGVAAASTTADGSWLDWEYLGSNELLITGRGATASTASGPIKIYTPNGANESARKPTIAVSQARAKAATFTIPSLPANGMLRIMGSYQKVSGGAGGPNCSVHLGSVGGSLSSATEIAGQFITGTGANAGGQFEVWIFGNGTDQTSVRCVTVANNPQPIGSSLASTTFKTFTLTTSAPFDINIAITTDATDTAKVVDAMVILIDPSLSA